MKFRLIDLPRPVNLPEYQDSIAEILRILGKQDAVKSVFRIGGVSSPGISDIDLYVVFRNGTSYLENPVKQLKGTASYLFTHNLFGTEESFAVQMEPYTFFGKYDLLQGESVNMKQYELPAAEVGIVEKQVALEYLAKAFLSISVSMGSGIIKARNILLHAKALLLDLRLLGIETIPESSPIHSIVNLRNRWYSDAQPEKELQSLIIPYQKALAAILQKAIKEHRFYVMPDTNMTVAKNMRLTDHQEIKVRNKGLQVPGFLTTHSKRFLQLHRKFGRHELSLPLTTGNIPGVLVKRTQLFRNAELLNKERFPGFLPTAYGLHLFKPVHS